MNRFTRASFSDARHAMVSRKLELAALFALLTLVTQLVFTNSMRQLPLAYLPLPFLIWAAFRFGRVTVLLASGLISVLAVTNTLQGQGVFALTTDELKLLVLITYAAVVLGLGGMLAFLLHQRDQNALRLIRERDTLELRVQERTAALQEDIRFRKRIEQQLAEAQRLSQVGSWELDLGTETLTWSDYMYCMLGLERGQTTPTVEKILAMAAPEDRGPLEEAIQTCRRTGRPFQLEHRLLLPSGQVRIMSVRGGVSEEPGQPRRMFGSVRDITEERQAEAALRDAKERYRMVVELSPDAILVQQDDTFVFGNPAAFTLLGGNDPCAVLGKPAQQFFGEESLATVEGKLAYLRSTEMRMRVEETLRRVDGTTIDVELHAAPFTHESKTASLLILRDITERKRTLEQITHLAHFDSLTGLPNRTLFRQRLEHALQLSARPGHSVEVLFLDLDHFKNINDTLGHAVGDRVLQETARRLHSILRESDTVARLGGDEFVVLVENTNEPYRGGVIAEKILAAFAPPFLAESHLLSITTSIGIASFPRDGSDTETLLKHADIAMYRAKESGRNHYHRFSQDSGQQASEDVSRETALEADLASAVGREQLMLVYQPRMDVPSNRITGMEALLRWQHPALGLLPPERFLPLAERTGLIRQIGDWTLRRACSQNKTWQDSGSMQVVVAVNLSARQLEDEHLAENVAAILQETGLAPAFLELEIAESAVMANPERAMLALGALRDLGVGVTIDHFGVGYSSFTYLRQFPVHAIQIDRSFVQGISVNHDDRAITRAIIDFAHGLEVSVIAQGAETRQQVEFLREHECDSVQGFYFSEPVSADVSGGLLRAPANLPLH